jgi:hypothetical protein
VAARLSSVGRLGTEMATISTTVAERVATLREVLGSLAPAAEAAYETPAPSQGAATADGLGGRAATAHEALAGLRLPDLAPVPRASWVRRAAGRLNPFSLDRVTPRHVPPPGPSADGDAAARRPAAEPITPLAPLGDLGRRLNAALAFLVAMQGERY